MNEVEGYFWMRERYVIYAPDCYVYKQVLESLLLMSILYFITYSSPAI